MDHTHQHDDIEPTPRRGKWVLLGFLLIAGFFLFSEHRAHLPGFLPYLLFLACPLIHRFHHGLGHHGSGASNSSSARRGQEQAGDEP